MTKREVFALVMSGIVVLLMFNTVLDEMEKAVCELCENETGIKGGNGTTWNCTQFNKLTDCSRLLP